MLKDRKGRELNYHDLTHYQNIITAILSTISMMKKVDEIIDNSSGNWYNPNPQKRTRQKGKAAKILTTYPSPYSELLKIDFPAIPLTSNPELF